MSLLALMTTVALAGCNQEPNTAEANPKTTQEAIECIYEIEINQKGSRDGRLAENVGSCSLTGLGVTTSIEYKVPPGRDFYITCIGEGKKPDIIWYTGVGEPIKTELPIPEEDAIEHELRVCR